MFEKKQDQFKNDPHSTLRQISIPPDLVLFAKGLKQFDNRKANERATLADIYHGLAEEGARRLINGAIKNPTFAEPKREPGSTYVQIAFEGNFYTVLKSLCDRISVDKEWTLSEGTEVSIIGLAVCLMRYAVDEQKAKRKTATVTN